MGVLDVRDQITNVDGGMAGRTYVVQVTLFDSETGALVSQAVSAAVVVPASEPLTPTVQVPIVQLRPERGDRGERPDRGVPGLRPPRPV